MILKYKKEEFEEFIYNWLINDENISVKFFINEKGDFCETTHFYHKKLDEPAKEWDETSIILHMVRE